MARNTSIDELWGEVRKNDTFAFRHLYEKYYPGLCYYAHELLNDHFVAEEVVQDMFCVIWEKRNDIFSQGNSLQTYLYRLIHNRCIDILKHQRTRKNSMIRLLSSEGWMAVSEKYGFDEYLIEQLEADNTEQTINQIISNLPEQCRDIFIQSRMQDKSNEEIAKQMGLSVNTVRTQIYRALKKIKEKTGVFFAVFLFFAVTSLLI